jgi:hypothetical protein
VEQRELEAWADVHQECGGDHTAIYIWQASENCTPKGLFLLHVN